MIITYFRSSSFNAHEMCPMKHFLIYGLGYREPSNKAADKGTIVHKVAEILAHIKKHQQDKIEVYEDDILGAINVKEYDLENIFNGCYDYYSSINTHHEWFEKDRRECRRWIEKAITLDGGKYDPRNCNIIRAEQPFDILIAHDWAHYTYELHGEKIEGQLAIKGTIDQISQLEDGVYQILDWKTGKRKNWATGKVKEYKDLQHDPQLLMYYYAIQHLYPQIKDFEVCIYFINDGGPFHLSFSPKDLPEVEEMLKKKFDEIRENQNPTQNKSWICQRMCHFGKNSFTGTHVRPIIERRLGQTTPFGQPMTMCEQTKLCLDHRGMDAVVENMAAQDFDPNYYQKPGGETPDAKI